MSQWWSPKVWEEQNSLAFSLLHFQGLPDIIPGGTPSPCTVKFPGWGGSILRLSSLPGHKTEADTELWSTGRPRLYTRIWHTDSTASPPHPETHGLRRNRVLEGQRNKSYWGVGGGLDLPTPDWLHGSVTGAQGKEGGPFLGVNALQSLYGVLNNSPCFVSEVQWDNIAYTGASGFSPGTVPPPTASLPFWDGFSASCSQAHAQWMPPPSTSARTWAGCQGSACDLSTKWQSGVQGAHGGLRPPSKYLHSWVNMILNSKFKTWQAWKDHRIKRSISHPLAFCTRSPAFLQFAHHPANYGVGPGWSSSLSRQTAFKVLSSWRADKKAS